MVRLMVEVQGAEHYNPTTTTINERKRRDNLKKDLVFKSTVEYTIEEEDDER